MNKRVTGAFGVFFLLLELAIVPKSVELMMNRHLSALSPEQIFSTAMTLGSIALCILMTYSALSDKDSYPLHTFLFELTVLLCCAAPFTELITEALNTTGWPAMNMLANTVFYMVGINMTYVIMMYEYLIIGERNKPVLKKTRYLATVLMLLDNLATLLNIPYGFFFVITENGMFQASPTYWTAYLAPGIIILLTVITAFREMRPCRQQKAFIFFWIFGILTSIIQMWRPSLSFQQAGYTLSLLVLYINIQSELDVPCTILKNQEER